MDLKKGILELEFQRTGDICDIPVEPGLSYVSEKTRKDIAALCGRLGNALGKDYAEKALEMEGRVLNIPSEIDLELIKVQEQARKQIAELKEIVEAGKKAEADIAELQKYEQLRSRVAQLYTLEDTLKS